MAYKHQLEMIFKYSLGAKVKSIVTDFEGVITSRSENLNGSHNYTVTARVNQEGDIRLCRMDPDEIFLIQDFMFRARTQNTGEPTTPNK